MLCSSRYISHVAPIKQSMCLMFEWLVNQWVHLQYRNIYIYFIKCFSILRRPQALHVHKSRSYITVRPLLNTHLMLTYVTLSGSNRFWFMQLLYPLSRSTIGRLIKPIRKYNVYTNEISGVYVCRSRHKVYRIMCTWFCCTMLRCKYIIVVSQWRNNGRHGVSNHQPHDCLLKRLFRRRSKKTSMLCSAVNSPPPHTHTQRANNAENVSIWWRHHVISWFMLSFNQYASWLYAWKCRDGHEIAMVVENDILMVFVAKGQYRVIWLRKNCSKSHLIGYIFQLWRNKTKYGVSKLNFNFIGDAIVPANLGLLEISCLDWRTSNCWHVCDTRCNNNLTGNCLIETNL